MKVDKKSSMSKTNLFHCNYMGCFEVRRISDLEDTLERFMNIIK